MGLQGNLKDMSLANLVQVNCQEMRTVRLTLAHRGQTAEIFIADGQVVHANSGAVQGEQVFYKALAWQDGTFSLDTDIPSPARTIQSPWSALVLEGMKRANDLQAEEKRALQTSSKSSSDLLARLGKIEGVGGVVLASSDGIILDTTIADSDGEREAAVAVFLGGAARQLGESLQLGEFQHGVVSSGNRRLLILQTIDRFCGLVLGERGSPALVASAAAQIFK